MSGAWVVDPNIVLTAAGVIGVPSVGALIFWVGRITRGEGKLEAAATAAGVAADAAAAVAVTASDAHRRLDELNQKFGDFKEIVAREYVPNHALIQLEARMTMEFQRVRDGLDKLFVPKA